MSLLDLSFSAQRGDTRQSEKEATRRQKEGKANKKERDSLRIEEFQFLLKEPVLCFGCPRTMKMRRGLGVKREQEIDFPTFAAMGFPPLAQVRSMM